MTSQHCLGKLVMLLAAANLATSCAHRQTPAVAIYRGASNTPYANPLVSPGAKFAALPPAVQHTVRAQTGGAEIEDIIKDTNSGRTVYRIYFANPGILPPLQVAPDGSILRPNSRVAAGAAEDSPTVASGGAAGGLAVRDLPPKVIETIQQQAPGLPVEDITKETWGNQAVYVISFAAKSPARLYLNSDGTVLTQTTR